MAAGASREFLDTQQEHAVNVGVFGAGNCVIVEGGAGTGKTMVLRNMVLRAFGEKRACIMITPTGTAAVNLNMATARTISSLLGVYDTDLRAEQLVAKIKGKNGMRADNRRMIGDFDDKGRGPLLIVDEMSMVSADVFDALVKVVESVRAASAKRRKIPISKNKSDILHGLRLVMFGDMRQAPPISKRCNKCGEGTGERSVCSVPGCSGEAKGRYFFEGEQMARLHATVVELKTIHRQRDDAEFQKYLTLVRHGDFASGMVSFFKRLDRPLPPEKERIAVHIMAKRNMAAAHNREMLDLLTGTEYVYNLRNTNNLPRFIRRWPLIRDVPKSMTLKHGARVMLTVNLDIARGLCNGRVGTIVGFEPVQMRSQAQRDVASIFGGVTGHPMFPRVRFDGIPDPILIKPYVHPINSSLHYVYQTQVPLMLAWAITGHKAQGMTLDAAIIDMDGCFGPGLAYVMLSRTRKSADMRVKNFSLRHVKADHVVSEWYKKAYAKLKAGTTIRHRAQQRMTSYFATEGAIIDETSLDSVGGDMERLIRAAKERQYQEQLDWYHAEMARWEEAMQKDPETAGYRPTPPKAPGSAKRSRSESVASPAARIFTGIASNKSAIEVESDDDDDDALVDAMLEAERAAAPAGAAERTTSVDSGFVTPSAPLSPAVRSEPPPAKRDPGAADRYRRLCQELSDDEDE